jgi:hypothetical protein
MKHWINRNYKTLIITAFLIPIVTVAIVSISHVTQWYGISNPLTWAVYLSVGIEIAAMSALAAISANMGRNVYFPFIVVTIIQFIGNIFFAYEYIDITNPMFKSWVELVSPLVSFMGVDPTDFIGHKRFLALFAGGLLPVISLSFLHMLVKFTEEDRLKDLKDEEETKLHTTEETKIDIPIVVDEDIRLKLSDDDLEVIEGILSRVKPTNRPTDQVTNDIDEEFDDLIPKPNYVFKSPGIHFYEKDNSIEDEKMWDVTLQDGLEDEETPDNPPIVEEETPDNPPIVENVPLIKHEQDYFLGNDGLNTPAKIETLPEPNDEDKKKT